MSNNNVKEELVHHIKKWLELDNNITSMKMKIKEFTLEKREMTNNLVNIMKNNDIDCVDIKGGALLYKQRKTKQSISRKYLLEQMNNIFKNDANMATELTEKIMQNRNEKIIEEIRRK